MIEAQPVVGVLMAPVLGEDPLYSVPPSIWWPAVTLIVLASVLILRVIANNVTINGPPVFEGVPFVGGILKFLQVRDPTGFGVVAGLLACWAARF